MSDSLHNLLQRQLRKYPLPRIDGELIAAIDAAYRQFDRDREMLERSLDLTSHELLVKNEQLSRSVTLLHTALESTADGILVTDLNGRVIARNGRLQAMWTLPLATIEAGEDAIIQHFQGMVIHPGSSLNEPVQSGSEVRELWNLKDGRFFDCCIRPHLIDNRAVGRVWNFRDVTEQMNARDDLVHAAFHDPLTGLPNRSLFMNSLDRLITLALPDARMFAVFFLDLDRFKVINDGLGHIAGDILLVEIARKLRAMIPPHCMVARLGGDEFTVLAENAADEREIIHIAETILREIKSPMMVDGHEVYTTVSIGIALSTGDYRRPEEMIRDADTAMYQAKKQGKSRYQIFQAQMRARALEAVRVEADLRRALPGREFELFFQPIVRAQERQVIGFEALIRWNHPERGYISPLDFISVAEETGLIVQMGEWVVREACKAAKRSLGGRYVAVNLSAVQLQQPHFVETIRSALIGAALPPELLLLELTESVLMESDPAALQALGILRDMGVSLAIDDFGTGYSSLSYLKKFPVNVLKIDRSFVRETPADNSSCEITRVILSMCRILGLRVVAEGVENDAQLQFLSGEGCENIQGFFFSRPVPEKNIDSVIRSISGV